MGQGLDSPVGERENIERGAFQQDDFAESCRLGELSGLAALADSRKLRNAGEASDLALDRNAAAYRNCSPIE
jgi:hypothetical protein